MIKSNRRISYVAIGFIFAIIAVIVCLHIEKYAKTALDSKIKYSHESGFYDAPIEVELSVGSNYFITYTLDGRAPNAGSTRYEGPILITDASDNENVWSSIIETSLKYFESDYYKLPEDKVDKCAVLRAAAFDYSGNLVDSDVREYFIGFKDKAGYEDMYNLCVVTDPENLFDSERGIYVVGEYWDKKIESGKIYVMYDGENGWDKENVENWIWSGVESERPATIEVFSPDDELLMRDHCGVRVRGGFSRYSVQKPLGFYAREEYSGESTFSYDIFNDGSSIDKFLIHNSGDDFDVKMMDYVIYNALLRGKSSLVFTPMIPCNLFIEGEYWGPMYLMKDMDSNLISEAYGLDKDNIVLIKSGIVKECANDLLAEEEQQRWSEFENFVKTHDMSISENYEYVCSQMDIENFAEYAAIEIYIANADWHLDNNSAFWRTIKPESGKIYSDGKWRCGLFDVNLCFESEEEINKNTYHYAEWDMCYFVRKLCENEEFRNLYLKNLEKMETTFAPDVVEAIIDEWTETMEEPIRCNFKRFSINCDPDDKVEAEKQHIIDFCANRPNEMGKVNEWFFSKD